MTSRLSSEALNQLVPLLGSLARLVARGSQVSEAQLRTLLLGADLESEPAALEELKRWGKMLAALREQPSEDNRHATAEALMLRGLPEAPVLLAVDTVTGGGGVPPSPPRRLSASVTSLDLGELSPGQAASTEFEVQGGPGRVVVESDQVRVTPQQFGAGPTRIRVEVKPLGAGGVLWTALRLVTAGETLELPVVAQWTDTLAGSALSQQSANQDSDLIAMIERASDLIAMIEQALGVSSSGKQSATAATAPGPPSGSAEDEILKQLRQLLG